MEPEISDESTYSIGAVARLTGIPVDTVRMWERRYAVVQPQRNEGNKRRYGAEDVARLTLIKRLVDRGNPISTIARLSDQQLRDRLQLHEHAQTREERQTQRLSMLIYGSTLRFVSRDESEALHTLRFDGAFSNLADFERAAMQHRSEVLVFEFPALNADLAAATLAIARRVGNAMTVIVYGYAASSVLQRLTRFSELKLLRSPTTLAMIETACTGEVTRMDRRGMASVPPNGAGFDITAEKVKPRQFSDEMLAQVAVTATSIKCECPRHLADLLHRLNAFEAYSLDCESRNEKDNTIHSALHRATAHARATIETALTHLLTAEGIDIGVSNR